MLSDDQLEEFARDGIVRVPEAFGAEDAARMRAGLWRELGELHGIRPDDRRTWEPHRPTRLKASKKGPAADAILGPVLRGVLDQLLGSWVEPSHQGQVLVTMPTGDEWAVPHRQWHTDVGYDELPRDELVGVKVWALLGDLAAGGGGTPQIAGSHRVLARYLDRTDERDFSTVRDQVLASHEWFRQLTSENRSEDWVAEGDVDGIPVRVVELTGNAGDVYLTHPWVLHSIAPNARQAPRMMRSRMMWRQS
ncbi:phytanoyl-CoA dioxygenase family protein [Kribbella sp. NBC_01505]|uniref:phytanoyl-CoA dioxygenase family protein n=1 Tax=Kribbella sp. NBC_01505 TaxID=2903580 RepID=UPI003868BB18